MCQLEVSVGECQLVSRREPVHLVKPQAGEEVGERGVGTNDDRALRHICRVPRNGKDRGKRIAAAHAVCARGSHSRDNDSQCDKEQASS